MDPTFDELVKDFTIVDQYNYFQWFSRSYSGFNIKRVGVWSGWGSTSIWSVFPPGKKNWILPVKKVIYDINYNFEP